MVLRSRRCFSTPKLYRGSRRWCWGTWDWSWSHNWSGDHFSRIWSGKQMCWVSNPKCFVLFSILIHFWNSLDISLCVCVCVRLQQQRSFLISTKHLWNSLFPHHWPLCCCHCCCRLPAMTFGVNPCSFLGELCVAISSPPHPHVAPTFSECSTAHFMDIYVPEFCLLWLIIALDVQGFVLVMSQGAFKNKTDCLSLVGLPLPCFNLVFVYVCPAVRRFHRKFLYARCQIYYGCCFLLCSTCYSHI